MSEDNTERLQKYLARAGVASRRKAEELIEQGRVTLNGRVVTQMGTKVDPSRDEVRVDGQRIKLATSYMYIMLNKPRGVLSTMGDSRGRTTLANLVSVPQRLYPVGRLDYASEGLILLTDDGELSNILTHPRFEHDKEYRVAVRGQLSDEAVENWRRGVLLEGKRTAPARVEVISRQKDSTQLRVVMHEGRKRQIRRVAEMLGYQVQELTRIRLGPLELGLLEPGQWRYLTPKEIRTLDTLKSQVARSAGAAGQRRPSPRKRGHGQGSAVERDDERSPGRRGDEARRATGRDRDPRSGTERDRARRRGRR